MRGLLSQLKPLIWAKQISPLLAFLKFRNSFIVFISRFGSFLCTYKMKSIKNIFFIYFLILKNGVSTERFKRFGHSVAQIRPEKISSRFGSGENHSRN